MQFDWLSSIIGFLVGTATGAAGAYFGQKYTDIRRESEYKSQLKKEFSKLKKQMPELISEFKQDLSKKDNKLMREFFVLPNKRVCLGGSEKSRFVYYEEEHENLRSKIDLLECSGFLSDVTPGNTPIYRMSEEFVELLNVGK